MRILLPCLLILSLAVLPACQMNERLSGTIMGGVGGGVIGGLAGGGVGAVIGTAAGAAAGYLVGDYIADRRERGRPSVFGNPPGGTPYQRPSYQGGGEMAAGVMGVKVNPREEAAREAYERGRKSLTSKAAREAYEQSIELDPSKPGPYNALGLNALYRGERTEAEKYFRLALEKDPNYYAAKHNLAKVTGGAVIVR